MLALLQTISDHLLNGGFYYAIDALRRTATEEDLSRRTPVVGTTLKGNVVIAQTLKDVLSATDIGLIGERTFLLCALHQLPEETLGRLATGLDVARNVTELEYKKYVPEAVAKIAHERHIMTLPEYLRFSPKQELGKHLINKMLISGLLTQSDVHALVEEAVADPVRYWVPVVGRILMADAVEGVNAEFCCKVQMEEAADMSGWPPIGWPTQPN